MKIDGVRSLCQFEEKIGICVFESHLGCEWHLILRSYGGPLCRSTRHLLGSKFKSPAQFCGERGSETTLNTQNYVYALTEQTIQYMHVYKYIIDCLKQTCLFHVRLVAPGNPDRKNHICLQNWPKTLNLTTVLSTNLFPSVEMHAGDFAKLRVRHVDVETLALVDKSAAIRRQVNNLLLWDLPRGLVQLLYVLRYSRHILKPRQRLNWRSPSGRQELGWTAKLQRFEK